MNALEKARLVRVLVGLALCGGIASQLPQGSSVALAGDGYRLSAGGSLDVRGTNSLQAVTVAGAAAGAVSASGRAGTLSVVHSPLIASAIPLYDITQALTDTLAQVGKILDNAEQGERYRNDGPYTVFWPTDAALTKALGAAGIARLQRVEGKAEAREFLARLTVAGSYSLARLEALAAAGVTLKTLSGDAVVLKRDAGELTANGVVLLGDEHPARNGFVLTASGLIVGEQ